MASRMELTRQILFMAVRLLAEHPEGLPVAELWPLIKKRLPGVDEQWNAGGAASNTPELALTWKSGGLVKSGWVTKAHRRWYLTPVGRIAVRRHLDVSSFSVEADAGYQYWARHKEGFEAAKRLAEAVPEGSWVAVGDLAAQTGLDGARLTRLFQGERPEGWHRVLDSDGGVPDDAHVDERLRKEWQELLTADGLDALLGMVPQERRISGADLRQLVDDDAEGGDGTERPRRAWLVCRSNVHGMNLVEDWLAEGYCSLPASKLRELAPGATQEAVRAAVDEGYAHGSYGEGRRPAVLLGGGEWAGVHAAQESDHPGHDEHRRPVDRAGGRGDAAPLRVRGAAPRTGADPGGAGTLARGQGVA